MKNLTLSQVIQGYFINAHARQLSVHTIIDYKNVLQQLQRFLKVDYPFAQITTQQVAKFMGAQAGKKKKTLLNYHTAMSAMWAWAKVEGHVKENIIHGIKRPKPEQMEIVPYTVEDIKMMLASLERVKMYQRPGQAWQDRKTLEPERSRAIILLLCDSGLRASELCNIKIGHVDKKLMRIKVFGKGAKERFVYFSAKTAQAIWRYLATREDPKDSEYLFKNRVTHGRLNRSIVLKGLVAIGNRAGVKGVNIHRFRHFFAIQYLRNRGDVYTLQKLMGHSTLDMVKRYLAIAQSDVDASYKMASPVANLNL